MKKFSFVQLLRDCQRHSSREIVSSESEIEEEIENDGDEKLGIDTDDDIDDPFEDDCLLQSSSEIETDDEIEDPFEKAPKFSDIETDDDIEDLCA